MSGMFAPQPASRHRMSYDDVRPRMIKAEITNPAIGDFRAEIGWCVQRAFSLAGLTIKQAAALMDKEPAQVSRWIAGTERAHLDAIFAVEQLRQPFILALASLVDGATIFTEIRFEGGA